MADSKISALSSASTPLAGTEVLPIVQSGTTVKVAVSDLTAGRTTSATNFVNGYTAVVSAAGTTTLTAASNHIQKLSGSTTQTFKLPDATTITAGTAYLFDNDSTGLLTVVDNSSGAVTTVPSGSAQYVFLETAGTVAGSWGKYALIGGAGALSVTASKSASITNSLTLSGTDSTTMTFPSTSATIARTDAGQTFTGNQAATGSVTANTGGTTTGFVRQTGGSTELSTFGLVIQKFDNNTTTSNYFARFDINAGSAYSGAIAANGAGAAAFISYSDERLKENIQDLEPQLDKILALRPVTFDYKAGGSNTGFIAQNVKDVYPDAVGEDENGYLTLGGFSKTDARLIKAIHELKAELDATKAELAALKGQ